jgi:Xaa-Pro aminopeptidase
MAIVRRVIAIGDAGLQAACGAIKPGATEADVAAACVAALFAAGAHNLYGPFPVNVASGPRLMLKSVPPSPRSLEPGDLVFLDIEPEHYGYGTDLARTAVAGEAAAEQRHMLEAALQAEEAAMAATRAGARLRDLERAAAAAAEGLGFPRGYSCKVHGLGTTKFRDVPRPHELEYVLRAGEVVNCESILVVPALGQATVEDSLLVREGGCEVLSAAARRLW